MRKSEKQKTEKQREHLGYKLVKYINMKTQVLKNQSNQLQQVYYDKKFFKYSPFGKTFDLQKQTKMWDNLMLQTV